MPRDTIGGSLSPRDEWSPVHGAFHLSPGDAHDDGHATGPLPRLALNVPGEPLVVRRPADRRARPGAVRVAVRNRPRCSKTTRTGPDPRARAPRGYEYGETRGASSMAVMSRWSAMATRRPATATRPVSRSTTARPSEIWMRGDGRKPGRSAKPSVNTVCVQTRSSPRPGAGAWRRRD